MPYVGCTVRCGLIRYRPVNLDRTGCSSGAPTYVTRSAREQLGDTAIRGRILPSARVFSTESAREIVRFIVRRNLDVLVGRRRA